LHLAAIWNFSEKFPVKLKIFGVRSRQTLAMRGRYDRLFVENDRPILSNTMRKTNTFITLETRRVTIVHYRRRTATRWCSTCGANVLALLPEEAASFRVTSPQAVLEEINNGSMHFSKATDGEMLVCCGAISIKK
jgi:hypothetical protein